MISGVDSLNTGAIITKYYRILKQDQSKRGEQRENFRKQYFSIPVSSENKKLSQIDINNAKTTHDDKCTMEKINEVINEKNESITDIREKNKLLKRKLDRRDTNLTNKKGSMGKKIKIEKELGKERKKVNITKTSPYKRNPRFAPNI